MATLSPAHSPLSQRGLDAERDESEAQHFLTIRQLALIATLGVAAWAAVLGPFLF